MGSVAVQNGFVNTVSNRLVGSPTSKFKTVQGDFWRGLDELSLPDMPSPLSYIQRLRIGTQIDGTAYTPNFAAYRADTKLVWHRCAAQYFETDNSTVTTSFEFKWHNPRGRDTVLGC